MYFACFVTCKLTFVTCTLMFYYMYFTCLLYVFHMLVICRWNSLYVFSVFFTSIRCSMHIFLYLT